MTLGLLYPWARVRTAELADVVGWDIDFGAV